jgi:hypothetical protein
MQMLPFSHSWYADKRGNQSQRCFGKAQNDLGKKKNRYSKAKNDLLQKKNRYPFLEKEGRSKILSKKETAVCFQGE